MRIIPLALAFLVLPVMAHADGVIGVDSLFGINAVEFLVPDPTYPEYAQVFNYFFTIEIFAGLVGLFIRILLRVFRM